MSIREFFEKARSLECFFAACGLAPCEAARVDREAVASAEKKHLRRERRAARPVIMRKFVICNLQFVMAVTFCVTAFADNYNEASKDYIYGDYQDSLEKVQYLKGGDEGLYLSGLNHLKLSDYTAARHDFEAILNHGSKNLLASQAAIKIADTYFLEHNFSQAKQLYQKLTTASVGKNFMPLLYLRLAQIAAKEGRWPDKRSYLGRLKEQYPASAEIKYAAILENYGDFFTIQVGAFSSLANAEAIRNDLRARYDVYVVRDIGGAITVYRVRVGKFARRDEAERACARLSDDGYPAIVYP